MQGSTMDGYAKNTYFFDARKALDEALKRKRVRTSHPDIDALQVCYYDGEVLPDAPENCINVPVGNLYTYLLTTRNRLPEDLNFEGKEFSDDVKVQLARAIVEVLEAVYRDRAVLQQQLSDEARNLKPDFGRGLRFFLSASRQTAVMRHVSKNIADTLAKLGYDVCFSIEENEMEQLSALHHLQRYLDFKPNVTININHMNNAHLHEDVYNFVWFQDPMPVLLGTEPISLRKRDYVYHLVEHLKVLLDNKHIPSRYQPFCINTDLYHPRPEIVRENKIVFIGSSYRDRLSGDPRDEAVLHDLKRLLEDGNITDEEVAMIASRHGSTTEFVHLLIGYLLRDYLVLELCRCNTPYAIELYGWGWDAYPEFKPFYKGMLSYGEEISKIYNSAALAFVPAQHVIQQRTLEAAASGAIPLVYDYRNASESEPEEVAEGVIYFRTLGELRQILNRPVPNDKHPEKLVYRHTYEGFVETIIRTVQQGLAHS